MSLRTILESFGAGDYYSLTIVLGSMAMSVMLPLGGKLGNMFGRKKLFAWGMIGFLVSEVILAAAQRYWQTVLGIVLCGAAYGLAWVQNAALIVDIYPKEKQPLILGGVFVATSVGTALVGCAVNVAESAGALQPLRTGLQAILGLVFLSGFALIPLALRFRWSRLSDGPADAI